mmetsp:Transcript_27886/g.65827  ORF Transcript_27886/g.65827 Transcript_27886/m.65827 type:complete len:263 (-) Transcript_27886:361-1149(-)
MKTKAPFVAGAPQLASKTPAVAVDATAHSSASVGSVAPTDGFAPWARGASLAGGTVASSAVTSTLRSEAAPASLQKRTVPTTRSAPSATRTHCGLESSWASAVSAHVLSEPSTASALGTPSQSLKVDWCALHVSLAKEPHERTRSHSRFSATQIAEHPSPLSKFPSSHASPSPRPTIPSPHTLLVQVAVQAPSTTFPAPSSHSSPLSSTPLPHRQPSTTSYLEKPTMHVHWPSSDSAARAELGGQMLQLPAASHILVGQLHP